VSSLPGATGFIGSAIVSELIAAGHSVLGLARSDAARSSLAAAGADAHRGSLEDLDSLRRGAGPVGRRHPQPPSSTISRRSGTNCETDRRAIEALGAALAGSDRPLIVTRGRGVLDAWASRTEDNGIPCKLADSPRRHGRGSCRGGIARRARLGHTPHAIGSRRRRSRFVPILIGMAREKGVSAYMGDGPQPLAGGASTLTPLISTGSHSRMVALHARYHGVRRFGRAVPRHRRRDRADASTCRSSARPLKRPLTISAGSRTSQGSTIRRRASRRGNGWDGQPRQPGLMGRSRSAAVFRRLNRQAHSAFSGGDRCASLPGPNGGGVAPVVRRCPPVRRQRGASRQRAR